MLETKQADRFSLMRRIIRRMTMAVRKEYSIHKAPIAKRTPAKMKMKLAPISSLYLSKISMARDDQRFQKGVM